MNVEQMIRDLARYRGTDEDEVRNYYGIEET